eukprot:TRINITY_DN825_c0_g1_i2.p1 TRINITY_DN825_c0_g1~~TRINITY_DN825_c0_g1_i2.p1  ORF type:complete len:637 (+),score=310.15 TRINITY_DN825_c0_g1_i2:282-2192(+)
MDPAATELTKTKSVTDLHSPSSSSSSSSSSSKKTKKEKKNSKAGSSQPSSPDRSEGEQHNGTDKEHAEKEKEKRKSDDSGEGLDSPHRSGSPSPKDSSPSSPSSSSSMTSSGGNGLSGSGESGRKNSTDGRKNSSAGMGSGSASGSGSPSTSKKAFRKKSSSDIYSGTAKKMSLKKLLQINPYAVLRILSAASADEEDLGIALGTLFYTHTYSLRVSFYCLQSEIAKTNEFELLLRGSGVNTRLLSTIARLAGYQYLKNLLLPLIQEVISGKRALEINPAKLQPEETVEQNLQNLLKISKDLITAIKSSVANLPLIVASICSELHESTQQKFGQTGPQAISSFLLLRFICPALTMPDKYELLQECSLDLRRKLILIAKVIQAVFNQTIEEKEEWMQAVLPFVEESKGEVAAICESIRNTTKDTNPKLFIKQLIGLNVSKSARKTAEELVYFFINQHLDDIKSATSNYIASAPLDDEPGLLLKAAVAKEQTILQVDDSPPDFLPMAEGFLIWLNSIKKRGSSLTHADNVYAELLALPSDPDDYASCVIRITTESKKIKMLTVEREGMTVEWIGQAVKSSFAKVERVEYLKDGERITLDKTSWFDFIGSAVVANKTATYRVFLTRKSAPALSKYMDRL